MKKTITLYALFISINSFAGHIAGGEMFYKYLGPGRSANSDSFEITLRLFRECHPVGTAAVLPGDVVIGIFINSAPSSLLRSIDVGRSSFEVLNLNSPSSCIINPPEVCYQIGSYIFKEELPRRPEGYVIAYQTCCRSNSVVNIQTFDIPGGNGMPGEGATYVGEIPGTNILGADGTNSSAVFSLKDTVLVCQEKNLKLDFSASDPDGDSLSYAFCYAYNRGVAISSANVIPSNPPYRNVTYASSYSGTSPLGVGVTIDPKTGIINGNAPPGGAYVVNVCVSEWRNGNVISTHRKDFILRVGTCDFVAAELPIQILSCDGFTVTFENESTSPNITGYFWDFGVVPIASDTSTRPKPTYTYQDTGIYQAKLIVSGDVGCVDSGTTQVYVFPGFTPDFTFDGSCFQNPYHFIDGTFSQYGNVYNWRWDFGDVASSSDTSVAQNPFYQYLSPGTRNVKLVVSNTKGCTDSLTKELNILDKPSLLLPFHDTLICNIDTLKLVSNISSPTAILNWLPGYNIIDPNSSTPLVYPKETTTYLVNLNDLGCINTDSVKVNVISSVFVDIGQDTSICLTDSFQLHPNTNALYFNWSPVDGISTYTVRDPFVRPLNNIAYHVTASVGKCVASDDINIKVAPYPAAEAGQDTSICYSTSIILNGSITGSSFAWFPPGSLLNENTLNPIAGPGSTTAYILSAYDTLGCSKPGNDTVVITVIPHVPAFAGNDTIIVVNQPLQMNATGGILYAWSPSTGMSDPNIPNPVVTLGYSVDSVTYRVRVSTPEGCFAYDDMTVHVFKTLPEIFVPTGFTPNGDGKNDILKPTVVGMKQFLFFRVFNRLGQLLYATNELGKGWDGTLSGTPQASGTYVFDAEAIDYLGQTIRRRGVAVLIR